MDASTHMTATRCKTITPPCRNSRRDGRQRGGLADRCLGIWPVISRLADALGRLLRFQVTPGQSNDITVAPDLLDGLRVQAIHADKACDGNDLRVRIAAMKAMAVPPSNRNRKLSIPHDTTIY
jgi:hypothetical protein